MLTNERQIEIDRPTASVEIDGGGIALREIFAMVRRKLVLIIIIAVVGTCLAALAGYMRTPQYRATAAILIEPLDDEILTTANGGKGRADDGPTVIDTQIALMTSSVQLKPVMHKLSQLDPRLPHLFGDEDTLSVDFGGVFKKAADLLPESWLVAAGLAQPASAPLPLEESEQAAIDRFQRNLAIEQVGESMVINISYTSPDPNEAAQVSNVFADTYVGIQLDRRRQAAEGAARWFRGRLDELQETVRNSEQAAIDFRLKQGFGGPAGGKLNEQALLNTNQKLDDLRAERMAKQDLLSQARETLSNQSDLETLAESLGSPLIAGLLIRETELLNERVDLTQTYGDHHPMMVRLLAQLAQIRKKMSDEVGRGIRNLETQLRMLESREAALLEELRSIERDQERNQQLEVQLAELERQSEANRDHYEALLRRSKMTQEQQKSLLPQARIISLAVAPRSPSTPSPYVFAMVGFATSSMLGVGLGLVLERMNGRVRSVADLERALGLPVLGVAPRLPSRKARKYPARYIAQKPLSTMAESAFSILTSARSAKDGSEPVALLVTSALASEGKTTLSILLAATATALRYKTLLVELDLRRPTLNARLGAHADQPGLADYLLGELRRDQLIQRDPQSDIEYIPAGLPPALPPALLTGPKLRELIDSLRSEYTCIILDSAPVLAVTEARITSCLADRVILAARWRKSHVSAVIDAASALRQASSDIAGCVLTDVDTSKYRLDALDRGSYYSNSQRYYTN